MFSPCSLVTSPTDSHERIDSSWDLIQAPGLLDTDLTEQHCLSDNVKLISNKSSPSVIVDLSSNLQLCASSSVSRVTRDFVEPCGSVCDTQDIAQDSLSPENSDHDLFVPIHSILPTMDLSRAVQNRGYSSVPCMTHDFVDCCGFVLDSRDIIHDLFVEPTCDNDVFVLASASDSSPDDASPCSSIARVLDNVESDMFSSPALVNDDPSYGIFLHDTLCFGRF